jgi:hypothetical protein
MGCHQAQGPTPPAVIAMTGVSTKAGRTEHSRQIIESRSLLVSAIVPIKNGCFLGPYRFRQDEGKTAGAWRAPGLTGAKTFKRQAKS